MAYTALTDAETATGAAVTQTLWRKVKDNLDYLLSGIATSGVTTSVLNGSFEIDSDADGIPDTWTRSLYAGGSSALSTTAPMHGAVTLALTHPGGAGNGGGYFESDYVLVSQLHDVWIGWLMYASASGMKNEVVVRAFDKDLAEVGSGTVVFTSTANPTSATYFIRKFTPPATTRFITLRLIGGKNDTNVAGTTYFDNVTINPFLNGFGGFTIGEQTTTAGTFTDAGSATVTLPNMGTILLNLGFFALTKTDGVAPDAYQRFRIGAYYSNQGGNNTASYIGNSYALTAWVDTTAPVTVYQQLRSSDGTNTVYGQKATSQSVAVFGL